MGDVRAEHAAVVVALVDDDVLQGAEEPRPAVVGRQQRAVEHVGVGEDVLPVVARPVALLARAVTVVGCEAYVEAQRREAGELVVGERLRRGEVEHRGAALTARAPRRPDGGQCRELVGQRLPRRRPGRHDHVVARVGGVGRDHLVAPWPGHTLGGEGATDVVRHPLRPVLVHRLARGQHLQVLHPVLAPGDPREPRDQRLHRGQQVGAVRAHGPSLANASDTVGGGVEGAGRGTRGGQERERCWGVLRNPSDSWFDTTRNDQVGTWCARTRTVRAFGDRGIVVDLTLATREVDGRAIVAVGGEIDVYTAPKLRDCITELVGAGTYDIIIDLEAVEFLDSTGLGVLVGGLKKVRAHDGSLDLVCTQERLLKIFRITGLAKVFVIHDAVGLAPGA